MPRISVSARPARAAYRNALRTVDTASLTVSSGLRTAKTQWSGWPGLKPRVVNGMASLTTSVPPIDPELYCRFCVRNAADVVARVLPGDVEAGRDHHDLGALSRGVRITEKDDLRRTKGRLEALL